jgi:hypothetical protein
LSPVSAARANGVAQLTGYAATVRIWSAILVALVACTNHDVERLTDVKRDVCACKDTRCADQAMSRVAKASIKSTPRTQAIARDIMECRARLEAAERPSTDPDAEGGSEGSQGGADRAPGAGSAGPLPAKPAPPKSAP